MWVLARGANSMERYDIVIIGTGPAGLSAAITAKIRNKDILLIGNKALSDKIEKAHTIHNYLGLPEQSGGDLAKAFCNHLGAMKVAITEDRVNAVYSMGNYFAIQGHANNYEAYSVILATGVSVTKPYKGEEENLGRGVSYCATCDAPLYRGKRAAVIAFSKEEETEASFLAQIAKKVYYFPMYDGEISLSDNIDVISLEKPERIEKLEEEMCLVTDENRYIVDGIFILRDIVAPKQLVPGLKVVENSVEVNRRMETNLEGLFACGDITGAPYQYIKSAGEGNVAALSAVSFLDRKCNKENL